MAENTIVLPCGCSDADQDIIYGKGKRLHNKRFAKGKETGDAYCTVCAAPNRLLRISFVYPKPNQFGPLDKDPSVKRNKKTYEVKKGAVKEEKKPKLEPLSKAA